MKRLFGKVEAVFDIGYLIAALVIGIILLTTGENGQGRTLAGIMALVLVGGDAFHLIPRIMAVFSGQEEKLRPALGRGKQITSITMTVFYLLLWQIGLRVFNSSGMILWTYVGYGFAVILSFGCYLPVVLWANVNPKIGMLMLPKTCAYLWMLGMCLSL